MKLIHIADLHLGKTVNEMNLMEDQRFVLKQVLEIIETEHVEGVLIAGDVYDRSVPSAEAVKLFDWFLTSAAQKGVFVCCIGGNHDAGERLNFGKHLFEQENLYVEGVLEKRIRVVEKKDAYGDILIHLLPFFKPAHVRALYPEENPSTYEDAMKIVLNHHKIDKEKRNILVTHQFITGMEPAARSDSEQELTVGGTEQISYEIFGDFDYVALGHLHGPQKAGRETVRYSGSLLKYSFSEEFQKKSVSVIQMDQKGVVEIRTVPLKLFHEMRTIKGPLEALIAEEISSQGDSMDYIRACVTDKEALVDPAGKIRKVYPNLMELVIEKNHYQGKTTTSICRKEKTPLELGEAFLKMTAGEAEEQRMQLLKALLEEGREG